MNPFSANLTSMRTARRLKHDDLARALDLSRVTIAYYETDKRIPTFQKVTALAKFFGVSISDLLLTDAEKTTQQGEEAIYHICTAIRRHCDAQNISPQRLSRAAGLPFSAIQSILTPDVQNRPALDPVLMIVLVLHRSVTELLDEQNVEPPQKKTRKRNRPPYSAESMVGRIDSLPIDSRMALSIYLDFLVDRARRTE